MDTVRPVRKIPPEAETGPNSYARLAKTLRAVPRKDLMPGNNRLRNDHSAKPGKNSKVPLRNGDRR